MLENLSLDGKTIVITGGGTGLGREMVLAMGRAGADIVIGARRMGPIEEVAGLIRDMGRRSMAISTDVTDSSQVDGLVQKTLDEFGKIDVMFNNAGIVRGQGATPIWEITDDDWRLGIDTNLTGAFYGSRAVAKHMVDRGEGKIINVSSGFGLRGGRDNYMYACGKGGVIQLTRTLATSLGRYGVTSNLVVPGFLPTDGTDESRLVLPRGQFIPIGRVGNPREMGPIAVFLASSASDYMNGEMFIIDGGGLAGGIAPTGYAPEIPLQI
ncbi:MAG: SDR family oxidoreductase [Planctomycetes bacterium]|nr:SDR family oxidoreductase [Planctomycetota bacterium]